MPLKDYSGVVGASTDTDKEKLAQRFGVSSYNRPGSRNARKAAVIAEIRDMELASAKAEMQQLREENKNLRGIIQKLRSLDFNEIASEGSFSESNVEGSDGSLDNDMLDPAASIAQARSMQPKDDSAADFVNSSSGCGKYPPIEFPGQQKVVEGQDRLQTDFETHNQLAQAILNRQIAQYQKIFPRKTLEVESASVGVTEVLEGSLNHLRSIYEIPDNFDPESDYNLSDVETVTSDEVLQAWGIEQQSSTNEEIVPLSAEEDETYEAADEEDGDGSDGDDDDDSDWGAVNNKHSFASENEPTSVSKPTTSVDAEYPDLHESVATGSENEEDDTSTVLGEPRSASMQSDDDKTSTVAKTGSWGSNDERWLASMRDRTEDIAVIDLEKVRSEAEEEERDIRDKEYRNATAEQQEIPARSHEFGHAVYIPQDSFATLTNRNLNKPDTATSLAGNMIGKDTRSYSSDKPLQAARLILPTDKASSTIPPSTSTSRTINPKDPWLINKFNEIWSSFSPELTAVSSNPVGWVNQKKTFENGNGRPINQTHEHLIENKVALGENNKSHISETERILRSFDPREDVLGILRPKAKGEKNILDNTPREVDPEPSNQVKIPKKNEKPAAREESVQLVGKAENVLKIKEERLRRLATDSEQRINTDQEINPAVFDVNIVEELNKAKQIPVTKKLSAPRSTPSRASAILDDLPSGFKPSEETNLPPKQKRKIQPALSPVKTGDLLNDPELMIQPTAMPTELRKDSGGSENEPRQKKSLRFHDTSSPPKAKMEMKARDPHPPLVPKLRQVVKGPLSRPLVSILKQDIPSTSVIPQPKNKSYNFEYIREVCIRNLPKDITYSSLLDQVSGGLLEKVTIDWNILEARITFAEPEAARRFYSKIEQNGFWVHTELPHIRLVGKEGLIQCTLGGFLWTQHSSQMSPSMIEGIWNRRASRCLLINNFPSKITTETLVKDTFRVFAGASIKETEIIETVGIKRNLQVSATGFMACARFTAIMFAVKVGKELRRIRPEYAEVDVLYDADPCGGLMGTEPPSVWIQGKVLEDAKREAEYSMLQSSKPQVVTALPQLSVTKPVGIRKGQSSPSERGKSFEASGRQLVSHLQHQIKTPVGNKAANLTVMAKTYSEAAQATATQPIHQSVSRIQPQLPRNQSRITQSLQEGLPPPKIAFRYHYNNWDTEQKVELPTPKGAHWNFKEQNLVHEYQQALMKKRRRGSDTDKAPTTSKIEKPKPETSYYDRLVYLTNLPRKLCVTRLLRFIRGGAVEYLILQPPSSQYDTSKAIVVFTHRHSARDYKAYLQSPGLTIERGHRIACMDNDPNDRRFDGIRLFPPHVIRSEAITRCLRIDMLPKGTTLDHVLGVIEEGMNHSALELEHASLGASPRDKSMVMVILRLISIGRAVWVAGTLRRNYEDIILSYDRDPCQGPLSELEQVDVKETD